MTYPSGFYVYRLIDPVTARPFYVGKGHRSRAWQHQRIVARGESTGNKRKDDRIRAIIALGRNVEVEIIARYNLEIDALDHEYRLVDADPTLTNVVPGGSSGNPFVAEKRRQKLKVIQHRKQVEAAGKSKGTSSYATIAPRWLPKVVLAVEHVESRPLPKSARKKGGSRRKRCRKLPSISPTSSAMLWPKQPYASMSLGVTEAHARLEPAPPRRAGGEVRPGTALSYD